jgi:hypothetical protein
MSLNYLMNHLILMIRLIQMNHLFQQTPKIHYFLSYLSYHLILMNHLILSYLMYQQILMNHLILNYLMSHLYQQIHYFLNFLMNR